MEYVTSGEFLTGKNALGTIGLRFAWQLQERTYAWEDEGEGAYIRWQLYADNDTDFRQSFTFERIRIWLNGVVIHDAQDYAISLSPNTLLAENRIIEYPFIQANYDSGAVPVNIRILYDIGIEGGDIEASHSWEMKPFARGATLRSAQNFTDEQNPTITYSNPAGERVTSLQACISLTGAEDDVEYRDIPKTGTTYTFELQGYEKQKLWDSIPTEKSRTVVFYVKTVSEGETFYSKLNYTFSVVNANPVLVPTITSTEHVELTGSEKMIKGFNHLSYDIGAIARKGSDLVSQSITNGGKTYNTMTGEILNTESNTFIVTATDTRGYTSSQTITLPMVDYFPPTINQDVRMQLDEAGGEGALIELNIEGKVFNGNFGVKNNAIRIEVSHTDNEGNEGDWVDLTPLIPEMNGNTYSLSTSITGLKYDMAYTFKCRVFDLVTGATTGEYTVSLNPVFDWSNENFNFNVDVQMNGETVLRHTGATTNNLVVSASGGHIYIRPAGTSDTLGEIKITPQGNIVLTGDIVINGVSLKARLGIS